jgi:hypothetical protein
MIRIQYTKANSARIFDVFALRAADTRGQRAASIPSSTVSVLAGETALHQRHNTGRYSLARIASNYDLLRGHRDKPLVITIIFRSVDEFPDADRRALNPRSCD